MKTSKLNKLKHMHCRLTVTDTDIWFKTREMQQTDLGKQMVQLQKDIKQMSKVLVLVLSSKGYKKMRYWSRRC